MTQDAFKALREFTPVPGKKGRYYSLAALEQAGLGKISRLPRSIRVVLEALVRHCDGKLVTEEHVRNLAAWQANGKRTSEIPFIVVRIVLLNCSLKLPIVSELSTPMCLSGCATACPRKLPYMRERG